MKPNYKSGDILIRRVKNGWVLVTSSDVEDTETEIFVYEDGESAGWMAESLFKLLSEQFECYLQSKHSPGIKMEFSRLTREEEEDTDGN
jgi:hypothetical protein